MRRTRPAQIQRTQQQVLDRTAEMAPAVAEPRSGDKWRTAAPLDAPLLRAFGRDLALPGRAGLVEPHAAYRRAQRRRPARAGAEHSLPVAVPREPDRRARAEPAGAGRDHRGRDRRLGHGRDRHDHHRSGQAARTADRRELRPDRRVAFGAGIPDQSGTRRAAAAPPGAADAHAGAHLRPRRRAAARYPQPLRPRRRAALRPDPGGRPAEPDGARLDRDQELVRTR